MAGNPVFTLYFFPFSLYSIMVRMAFSLAEKLDPTSVPLVELRLVNLHREENLTEEYLTLNPRGQVPVLASPAFSEPLTESYDIAKWLSLQIPDLIPEEHNVIISRLMDRLHGFHAQVLSVSLDLTKDDAPNQAAAMLENNRVTESHRRRLEIKSVFHDTAYSNTFDPDNIAHVEGQVIEFVKSLGKLVRERPIKARYLFGEKPTILDAHAIALLARLLDLGRNDLICDPDSRDYALGVMDTEEWQRVTLGKGTLWDMSHGDVSEVKLQWGSQMAGYY